MRGQKDKALWCDLTIHGSIKDTTASIRENFDVQLSRMGIETDDFNRPTNILGQPGPKANSNLKRMEGVTTIKWSAAHYIKSFETASGGVVTTRLNPDLLREFGLCKTCYTEGDQISDTVFRPRCFCQRKGSSGGPKMKKAKAGADVLAALLQSQSQHRA